MLRAAPPGARISRFAGVQLYDASADPGSETQQFVNISSRGEVGIGNGILIGGFVVTGNFPKRVLIRGVGPVLLRFGVPGPLADPVLRLYQGDTLIATNDDWFTDDVPAISAAAMQVGAFALDSGGKDATVLITLAPGLYTVQVSGTNDGSGLALLEVYDVP